MKHPVTAETPLNLPLPGIDWFGAWWDGWIALQRTQTDLLCGLAAAAHQAQREAFDEWVCRWGGGVPIDA